MYGLHDPWEHWVLAIAHLLDQQGQESQRYSVLLHYCLKKNWADGV